MNNLNEHNYEPAYLPPEVPEENSWALIIFERKLLMRKEEDKVYIPEVNAIESIVSDIKTMVYIGKYDGHECYSISYMEVPDLPENFEFVNMMDLTKQTGDAGLFSLVGTANHILHWYRMNQYCGCCGNKTENKEDERAKFCPNCGNLVYPRISPAVITAVFHEDKILLAHNRNFRKDLYSLIAGYVEPGESLEQCVEREILGEVGIKVKNIKYYSSQPWPFPDSLMMAFTAEYESGDIAVDNCEITDAAWYKADNLPEIPSTDSVAGKMIRWFRDL